MLGFHRFLLCSTVAAIFLQGVNIVPAHALDLSVVGSSTSPVRILEISSISSLNKAEFDQAMLTELNRVRALAGRAPLSIDADTNGKAQAWAEKMAAEQKIYHSPNDGIARAVYGGENVAMNSNRNITPRDLTQQWVNSPGHYQNMIYADYAHVGFGYAYDANGALYAVQQFIF